MGEDPVQKFWPFFTNELVCWIFFIIVIIINTIIIIIMMMMMMMTKMCGRMTHSGEMI